VIYQQFASDRPYRIVGRYHIFGRIAAGGMATIHYGRPRVAGGFSRTVAIKRMHPHLAEDPDFVAMFAKEARIAARIRHPNVVSTLDVLTAEDELFIVLEFVLGESLARLQRMQTASGVPAAPEIVAAVMGGVLRGLHAAHEAYDDEGWPLDVVHRDVSPPNVLVGMDGVARVLDFGVAQAGVGSEISRDGKLKGKLAYMSPEQIMGGVVDRTCDIYAASVVMWELLTGQRLFSADSDGAVIAAVLKGDVPRPSLVAPHVPTAFDRIVLRGLARAPSDRFSTAQAMAGAVERCVGIAPPVEVGEWVEKLAGTTISRRIAEIADIDRLSGTRDSPARYRAPDPDGRTLTTSMRQSPPGGIQGSSREISCVSNAPALRNPPIARRSHKDILIGAISSAAMVVAVLLGGRVRAPASVFPTAATSTATSAARAVIVVPVSALPVMAPPPTDTLPAPLAPATEAPRSRITPAIRVSEVRSPSPKVDCDPPFTVDGRGHKHYKEACL